MTPPTASTEPENAVVVIAHGSRSDQANEAHRAACRTLAERTGKSVMAAFLELAEPSLAAAVDVLAAAGIERVVVLPFFLYPGRHIQRDIPALVAAARAAHPSLDIELGPLFGDDPGVIEILAGQARSV